MSAALDLTAVGAGFGDPARDSQAAFRRMMDAMARPGLVVELTLAAAPPAILGRAAAAAALTLFDFETPVWLDAPLRDGAVETWLRFHAGCPVTADPQEAAFALVSRPLEMPELAAFDAGDAKYPDRSTTLILELEALEGGQPVALSGPGVKGERVISPMGLPDGFWAQLQANTAQFQFGVDVMLVASSKLMALPRSTRVQPKGD